MSRARAEKAVEIRLATLIRRQWPRARARQAAAMPRERGVSIEPGKADGIVLSPVTGLIIHRDITIRVTAIFLDIVSRARRAQRAPEAFAFSLTVG